VLREAVYEVEVEVTKELRCIIFNNEDHSQSSLIKLGKWLRHGLTYNHICLEEAKKMNDKVLVLQPLLEISVILLL
jgi:hypothetical protein